MTKKLIEVALPLAAMNAASAREKSIRHGHPSTLHLYWARRPLATCRAVIFSQLVDDPSSHPDKFPTIELVDAERDRLFAIMEELVLWENSTNEEVLEKAREEIRKNCGDKLPPIYDPFSGGGSIPLEAQRLGLKAYGSDLNPLAVMIGKSMIEIPPKFKDMKPVHPGIKDNSFYRNAEGLAEDVKHYGEWMRDKAFERIGKHFPSIDLTNENGPKNTKIIAWLWARTVQCPNPGCHGEIPLLSSFILSSKKGKEAYLNPEIKDGELTFSIDKKFFSDRLKVNEGFKRGVSGIFECPHCQNVTTRNYIAREGVEGRIGRVLTALVCEGVKGRFFIPAVKSPKFDYKVDFDTSFLETDFSQNPRDLWCRNFGLNKPRDLFTDRQLLGLHTYTNLIGEVRAQIEKDALSFGLADDSIPLRNGGLGAKAYSEAVSVYLAFGVTRLSDISNSLCVWSSSANQAVHLFGRQAIPMVWSYAETSLFSNMAGDFRTSLSSIVKVLLRFQPVALGEEFQRDAQTVKLPADSVISTDPPYYDNIGYADLSDFFYCWMKACLHSVYPDLFSYLTTPKGDELIAAAYRHGDKVSAEKFFLDGMRDAMTNLAHQTNDSFPTTIYYAFKQTEVEKEGVSSTGWATFLEAVMHAGFAIVGTWPVRTERETGLKVGINALANSVVLVCRKRDLDHGIISRSEFIRLLKRELPPAIATLQAANLSPADMPQSAIGPGIGIFSRYKSVLEADDRPMSVKTALQLINAELDEFLNDLHGDFDPETRFSINWFEQFGLSNGDYGAADNLARARGISVESVKHAGIIKSSAGKVCLLGRAELDPDWNPNSDTHLTIWECCQHLVKEYEDGGETAAAMLVKKIGFDKAQAVKDLAYYLYDICSNKRQDAKEATSYNALIAGWSDITRLADSIHETDTTRQASLF